MNKIVKGIGYCLIMPLWAAMIVAIVPFVLLLLISITITTGEWNWKRLWIEATEDHRYRVMSLPHRRREMEEADRVFNERVARVSNERVMAFLERRRHEQVNWKRDGF